MNSRPYSTPPPGRTSWWRKLAAFGAALALFGGTASAQCTNASSYGAAVAPVTIGVPTTISTCSYQSEYSTISGAAIGNQYQFNIQAGGYITVHSGTPSGPVIGFGTAPLTVTANNAALYPHWTVNAACTQASGCQVTTITNLGLPACTNVSFYGSIIANNVPAVPQTITTCNYLEEYSEVTGAIVTSQYTFAIATGGYVTVHAGTPTGPVIGAGTSPLQVTATSTALYPHWTVNAACTTESGICRTTTVTYNGVPPPPSCTCANVTSYGAGSPGGVGVPVTLSTCQWQAAEYSTVTGCVIGNNYTFNNTGANGGVYVTVHSGTPTGPIIGCGPAPFQVIADNTTLYPHWNLDAACGTASGSCYVSTVTNDGPSATCSGLPTAGTIPATFTTCANTPTVITITGSTAAAGITYTWEESLTSAVGPWSPVPGSLSSYTTPGFVGTRYYHAIVTCTNGGLTATTNSSTVNQNAACQFTVARNTAVTYNSIFGTGESNFVFSNVSTDDGCTDATSLAGTSFTYKGTPVTGFRAGTNGWMTFNTAILPTSYSNTLGSGATAPAALAPLWDDLACTPNDYLAATMDNCMRYKVVGTLGSGTAQIIIEWKNMNTLASATTAINFQVILSEAGNTITYRYGLMEGFTGGADTYWTYSLGLTTWSFGTAASYTDAMGLRDENTTNFDYQPATVSSSGLNGLIRLPACYSEYVFTPAAAYPGPGPVPSAAPSNDEIAGAEVLSVSPTLCAAGDLCTTYRTSQFATASAGIPVCSAVTPGTPDDDVWFKFNATNANTTIRVISGTGNDCVVQLLDATGTTALYCVNDFGSGLIESIAATGLTPGVDYLIRVYNAALGTPTNSRNDFGICVTPTPAPPSNDDCAGATTLTPGIGCTPISGNSLAATASAPGIGACSGTADDDVWYKFVAPGTGGVVTVQSVGSFNAAFDVYSSSTNDCLNLVNIACVNSTGPGALEQATLTALTPGNTYLIRVFHALGGSANGQFTICVDAGAQCPVLVSPADGGGTITLPVQLSWNAGTFASGYDVYFDSNNPPTTLVSSNQPGTTFNVNAPGPNGTYYWRVQSRNGLGATTSCTVRLVTVNIPSCSQPSAIAVAPTSGTTATVSWLCGSCTGTYIVEYGAPGFAPGTGASAGLGTIVTSASLSAPLIGLTSNTDYAVYVRQECTPGVSYSLNTGPIAFKSAEVLCGSSYYDTGGAGGSYSTSENIVRTFCGANAGEVVSVAFNNFTTETGYDPLYVFDGPSTAYPKIASANAAPYSNNVYGVGGWWGSIAPNNGTVVASDPSGCLTFAFTSDPSITYAGWDASVTCASPSACTVPNGVTATGVTSTTATISWTCASCTGTGQYYLEYGISGFIPGTGATAGGGTLIVGATSPTALSGLVSGVTYKAYVRQDCDGLGTTFSNNSYGPATFTTGPGCGSTYYDLGGAGGPYPNSLSLNPDIRTICPTNPSDKVIVTFSSFNVETNYDPLYAFDGTSTASPMIASANGVPYATPNFGTGGWWGTVAPTNTGFAGTVIATNPSGCLTFAQVSDPSVQYDGWVATVSCAHPQYDCASAGPIACGEQKSGFTFGGTNTLPVNGCAFNGGASTSGVSWWAYSAVATEDVSLSTCGLTTMDTRISVYKPMPDCNNLVCVGAVDDGPGCPNGTSTMRFKAEVGQLYYIAVSGNAANDGIFQLQLFCQPVCNLDLNDNDACGSATPITVQLQDGFQVLLDDDNSCSYVDGPTSCSGTGPAVGNWYSFVTNPGTAYRAYVVDNSISGAKTAQSLQYALFSGNCTDLLATGPVSCNSSGSGFTDLPALAPGGAPYKLFVYNNGSNSQVGSFGVWVDSPALYDAEITAVTSPVGTVCDLTLSPVVTLQNNGQITLTEADLEVSFDGGGAVATYHWTGSLVTGASTPVVLPLMAVPGGVHTITVSVQNPNTFNDQITANDAATVQYDATGQTVVVTVKTGNSGSQCSWGVYDAFFFPVGTGGPYTGQNNQTITTNVCLATTFGSCFFFFVFDNAGDGLVNGAGWDLNDSQGRSILRDNGDFIGQSPSTSPATPAYFAHEFCLPLGPSPIQASECNLFSNYLNNKVYTTLVSGTSTYQFEFSDPNAGFYRRISLPRNWVKFGEMVSSPLVYGTTYYCRARADQGAAGFSDDFFGAGCEMALAPSQPICTELISTPGATFSCGVTKRFNGSDKIWAQPVTYATQYRFHFVGMIDIDGPNPILATDTLGTDNFNDAPVYGSRNIVRSSYVCPLNWATYQLVNGQTYSVTVECFIGGVWSGFCGAPCSVTIQNPPSMMVEHADGTAGQTDVLLGGANVTMWPNPVRDGRVNLMIADLKDNDQMITIDVYDAFGKRVMTQHYENAGSVFTKVLDLDGSMASGNYMVNITVNDEVYIERLNVVR